MTSGARVTLTAEMIAQFERMLRVGLCLETCAPLMGSGVGVRTLYAWLRRGKQIFSGETPQPAASAANPLYLSLYEAKLRGCAGAESAVIGAIREAGQGDWKALAWLAERRFWKRWSSGKHELRQIKSEIQELRRLVADAIAQGASFR